MQFTTREKSYIDSPVTGKPGTSTSGQELVTNPTRESPSGNSNKGVEKR